MSHYIRTIHTSFTSGLPSSSSSSFSSSSPSSSSNILVSIPSIMNTYPPGISPDWRSPSGSSGSSTYNTHSKRRNTISLRTPTSPHRRAPPPPPPRIKFDPFADENSFEPSPVIYHTTPRTYAIHFPSTTLPQRRSFDKEARAKIVAGILLNRAQVGKPPRPRSMGEPKTYIKSCLSSVVSVEA